jgi:putative endonuclease
MYLFLVEIMRYIYILQCCDDTLYTGITLDLARRVEEHNISLKGAKYTKSRRPVQLIRSDTVANRSIATKVERLVKKCSKRKKQQLITGTISLTEFFAGAI